MGTHSTMATVEEVGGTGMLLRPALLIPPRGMGSRVNTTTTCPTGDEEEARKVVRLGRGLRQDGER